MFIRIGHHVLMMQAIESFRFVAQHNELEIRTMSGATHRMSVSGEMAANEIIDDTIERIEAAMGRATEMA